MSSVGKKLWLLHVLLWSCLLGSNSRRSQSPQIGFVLLDSASQVSKGCAFKRGSCPVKVNASVSVL